MRVIGSFSKGLKILSHLASHDGARLVDIAAAFDMPASNMLLFLNAMVREGFAVKGDDGYHCTARLQELADASGGITPIRNAALGIMRELHTAYDENVLLAVIDTGRLIFIERMQSLKSVQIINQENAFPPHVTAAGKAIMACWESARIKTYLDTATMERYTEKTITSRTKIESEIARTRERGFALNTGEYEDAIMAAAVPIRRGNTIASITVQFPSFRYRESELEARGKEILGRIGRMMPIAGIESALPKTL